MANAGKNGCAMFCGIVLLIAAVYAAFFEFVIPVSIVLGYCFLVQDPAKQPEVITYSSTDYHELLKRVPFDLDAASCEWNIKRKDNRRFLLDVPSPSDILLIVSGHVVLTDEAAKSIADRYQWEPFDRFVWESLSYSYFNSDLSFLPHDRPLLYSEAFKSDILETRPYGGIFLFDAGRNTLWFHLTHM